MTNDKNKIMLSVVLLIGAVIVIIGASLSFFSASKTVKNTFTMGDVEIKLTEPSYIENSTKDITPGKVAQKDPTIIGEKGNSYARIIVEFYDLESNTIITDEARLEKIKKVIFYDNDYNIDNDIETPNLIETSTYTTEELNTLLAANKITDLYNKESFELDAERSTTNKLVFNYKGVLHADDKATLFTNLVIPSDYKASDTALIGNVKINIYAQAIQAENMASQAAAYLELDGE